MRQQGLHGAVLIVTGVSLVTVLPVARADMASTYTMAEVLDWERASQMQMSISANDGDILPFSMLFTVIPLTTSLGLNETELQRGRIKISGILSLADETTYQSISGADTIPYLSCDQINGSYAKANEMLNNLMSKSPQPAAILLHSEKGQCCGLSGVNLHFQRILTMPDRIAAAQISNITTVSDTGKRASITGNVTDIDREQGSQAGGNNSALAMSILYSVTGLITVLFLVIIGTGAIRAHRYPERYGPRSGLGGRPRQSRAKGLARAVLETIPIVKFGYSHKIPPKPDPDPDPDPDVELGNFSSHAETRNTPEHIRGSHDSYSVCHLPTIPESPVDPTTLEVAGAVKDGNEMKGPSMGAGDSRAAGVGASSGDDQILGCSICTEDFNLGDDVRVLPCDHKFHPQCVDPWLVNVSGTCPLCRLDLRPDADQDGTAETSIANEPIEAPPIVHDATVANDSSTSNRRRTRFLDLALLRYAPVEERIEALRHYRSQQQLQQGNGSAQADDDSHGLQRARLSDRMRGRFNIRTRTAQQQQQPQ